MPRGRHLLHSAIVAGALVGSSVLSPPAASGEALQEPVDPITDELDWSRPVAGVRTSAFGFRVHPISRRRKLHAGVDFAAKRGARVNAARDGVVVYAKWRGGYGRLVVIDHGGGVTTRYAHLSRIRVRKGQRVSAGQRIGQVGSSGAATGPHLHFEIREDREPVDPAERLPFALVRASK